MNESFHRHVDSEPEAARAAVAEAAGLWNAAWAEEGSGGRLHLPVLAGVRRGRILARVEIAADGPRAEVRIEVESADYEINRTAVLVLSLGGLGGLSLILWPLAPARLLGFVPLGVVFLIGSWLLVGSRLRSAGPEDFLDTVAELAEDEAPPPGSTTQPGGVAGGES